MSLLMFSSRSCVHKDRWLLASAVLRNASVNTSTLRHHAATALQHFSWLMNRTGVMLNVIEYVPVSCRLDVRGQVIMIHNCSRCHDYEYGAAAALTHSFEYGALANLFVERVRRTVVGV